MDFIRSPNRWSCLPASFAMALGISFPQIISDIGHDGSKIIHPDLGEKLGRRCFHLQELTQVCLIRRVRAVQFDFELKSTPDGIRIHTEKNEKFVLSLMNEYSGVLLGRGLTGYHAVAWDNGTRRIYDPSVGIYKLGGLSVENPDSKIKTMMELPCFTPDSFILI